MPSTRTAPPPARRLAAPPVAARRAALPASSPAPADEADEAARELIEALRAVARELRLSEREAEQRLGVRPAQLLALRKLAERPAASLAELAERTHTDPSSASVVVQRLVERGLVARTPADADRRRIALAITPAGRALVRRAPETTHERVAHAVAQLGPRSTTPLVRGLGAFVRALREREQPES